MKVQLTKQQSAPGFYRERSRCRKVLEKLMAERNCDEKELLASQTDSWSLGGDLEKQLRKMIAEKSVVTS